MKLKKAAAFLSALLLSCQASLFPVAAAGTDASVSYTFPSSVAPGESFDIVVGFENIENAAAYAIMLDDASLLESGLAFSSATEIASTKAALFAPNPNDVNDVAAAYLSTVTLNDDLVKYTFKVPTTAPEGQVFTLLFSASVLNSKNEKIAASEGTAVSVTVNTATKPLVGDISNDGVVDISDAIMLFQYTMLPDLYPLTYGGRIDLTKDGSVDIADAIMLFQYSMLPDLYPIDWD